MGNPDHRTGKAIIIGGSMAGLFAGLHLRRLGWEVDIYERSPEKLAGRGAGIVTHRALFDALEMVGIATRADIGVEVVGRVVFDRDGTALMRNDMRQILTSWGHLHQLLMHRFPEANYHLGRDFQSSAQMRAGVAVRFADGTEAEGDLLVGADGIRSSVRSNCESDCRPLYTGYVAWRGLVAESEISQTHHRDLIPYMAFCLPPSEQMLGYPVAGHDNRIKAGGRSYNFVWYRPADSHSKLPHLLRDIDGNMNGVSIAPDRIRPQVVNEFRQAGQSLLSPQFAHLIAGVQEPFIQPIYDLAISRMVHGRIVIIGDAAFVARPHVGMGVTKAASDATALARTIKEFGTDIHAALAAFGKERGPVGNDIVRRGRALGASLQATGQPGDAGMRQQDPRTVMEQTAVSDFAQ